MLGVRRRARGLRAFTDASRVGLHAGRPATQQDKQVGGSGTDNPGRTRGRAPPFLTLRHSNRAHERTGAEAWHMK